MPIQTRGGIGKSTEAVARCEWMNQRDVDWKGHNLDQFNRTLNTTFSENVQFIQLGNEPEGEIITVLRSVVDYQVTCIDPSAHMNLAILRALEMCEFAQFAASAGVRATILVFPFDEISDMDDISATVDSLGDTVDWVVVRNRGRVRTTRFFDGSLLESRLQDYGAAFLEIPALLADTRNHIRAHEVQLGRGLSPAEILLNNQINIAFLHRVVFEDWLVKTLFRSYDAIASHLVPTASAARIPPPIQTPVTPVRKRGEMINLSNLL